MSADDPRALDTPAPRAAIAQALLLLLPAALLAWPGPGSFLDADFLPATTGAALAVLATLPGIALLAFRRHRGSARGLLLLLPLLSALPFVGAASSDTFERDRALAIVLVGLAQLACAASLDERARLVLARGLALLSIAYSAWALLDGGNANAGALGNTGSTAHAALAGAVVGACLLGERRGPWTLVYAAASALAIVYVLRTPVIATALALGGALALAAALSRGSRGLRATFGILALVALAGALAPLVRTNEVASDAPAATSTLDAAAAAAAARDTGGFEVRRLVWSATLGLVGEHPWLGAGLGQFARDFPAHRDPREIELSTHGRKIAQETEVEHAHSDPLTLAAEVGLPRALLALAFVALLAAAVWRALRDSDGSTSAGRMQGALAAASAALLANALVHGVLFEEPVASSLAFAAFGALIGPRERANLATRAVPFVLAVLLALQVPAALATLAHTRAMQPIYRSTPLSTDDTRAALERALEARPDSTLAATFLARHLEQQRVQPDLVAAAWLRVLEHRPERVEALMQLALACLRAGDRESARTHWDHAARLDPLHPGLAWNRMTLALEDERLDEARAALATLSGRGSLDVERLRRLGARLELLGRDASAAIAYQASAPDLVALAPQDAYERSQERRRANDGLLAAALEFRAQRAWAREHVAASRFDDAVRSYRQALRQSAAVEGLGAPRIRLEYAAALALAGKPDEADGETKGLAFLARDLAALPEWARAQANERGWKPVGGA